MSDYKQYILPQAPAYPVNDEILQQLSYGSITSVLQVDAGAIQIGAKQNDVTSVYSIAPTLQNITKFGGDGSDGELIIDSGTTTIDCQNIAVVTKNYVKIWITGSGKVAFSNPHANGTIIVLKSQGDIILTSSSAPMIDASAMGAAGGALGGTGANGTIGNSPNSNTVYNTLAGGQGGLTVSSAGSGGTSQGIVVTVNIAGKNTQLTVGAGGGGGAGSGLGAGGVGGRGGGALYLECAGSLQFTTTNGISVAGGAGAGGTVLNAAGGGGGGGGGLCILLYNSLINGSGTITVTGGAGGTGSASNGAVTGGGGGGGGASQNNNGNSGTAGNTVKGGDGGAGGAGSSILAKNSYF